MVTLDEAKTYLRVDFDDEDDLIEGLIASAENMVRDIARMESADFEASDDPDIKVAIYYALAYLYEHREEADHHELVITLRSLLFNVRGEGF